MPTPWTTNDARCSFSRSSRACRSPRSPTCSVPTPTPSTRASASCDESSRFSWKPPPQKETAVDQLDQVLAAIKREYEPDLEAPKRVRALIGGSLSTLGTSHAA